MRRLSNKRYCGRYTVEEFAEAKLLMYRCVEDVFGIGKVDKFLQYCAKNDWPKERSDTYFYAHLSDRESLKLLKYYDLAQDFLDLAHHGAQIREWEVYEGISESERLPEERGIRL